MEIGHKNKQTSIKLMFFLSFQFSKLLIYKINIYFSGEVWVGLVVGGGGLRAVSDGVKSERTERPLAEFGIC